MSSVSTTTAKPEPKSTLHELLTAVRYTVVTVIALGLVYPVVIWGIATLLFPHQAGGSLIAGSNGTVIGSELVGQNFSLPRYFHGRPSAAGKGNDPTQTGGTNFGPTSKKLIDGTRSAIDTLKKANPDAGGAIPIDLVTASASGIDPDISPAGAYFQAPRVAQAREISLDAVRALIAMNITPRQLGLLGEPRVNVLALNRALDARGVVPK